MAQIGRAMPPGVADAPAVFRAVRPDPVACVLLVIAGAAGIWQLFSPWLRVGAGAFDGGRTAPVTGWQVYRGLRALTAPTPQLSWATLAVLWCAIAGGALVLLGLAMLTPINHRPLGAAALLLSLLSAAGAFWVVSRAQLVFGTGVFGLFGQASFGLFLFLGSGLFGVIGSWKAMAGD